MEINTGWLVQNFIAKFFLPPLNLILLGAIGLFLLKNHPRLGKALIGLCLVLLYLLSTPFVSHMLSTPLEPPPLDLAKLPNQAGAIVILGGGTYFKAPEYGGDTIQETTLARLRYGAYLHALTGKPILVTGGAPYGGTPEARLMRDALVRDFKVPVRWVEDKSRNTAENAVFSEQILKKAGIRRIYIVTHAWHMSRAMEAFQKAGLEPVAAGTGYDTYRQLTPLSFLPKAVALLQSSYALHEWIGLVWYRIRY